MRASRRRIALLLTVVFGGLLGPNVVLAEPAGVRFLDETAIAVFREEGETQSLPLVLLNGTGQPTTIALYLVVAEGDDGNPFPITPTPGPTGLLETSPTIPIGEDWRLDVMLGSQLAAPDTYSGQLVALASDGSVARREISLTVEKAKASAETPSPSPNSGNFLAEPLPSITLATDRSSWPWDDKEPANAVTIPSDPDLFDRLIPGALVSESGELATVTVHPDGRIVVVGAGPGAYKGLLGRPQEGTETAPPKLTDLTLNVRDGIAWPVVVLMAGLLLAAFVEWATTDLFPKGALRRRLSELEQRANKAADEHRAEVRGAGATWLGDDGLDFRIHGLDEQRRRAVLSAAVEIALQDFDDTPSAEQRLGKWGTRGTEFGSLRALEESYERAIVHRREIQAAFGELRGAIPQRLRVQLDESGLRAAIGAALRGEVPISIDGWNDIKDRIAKVHEAATRAKHLGSFLGRLDELIRPGTPNQAAINRLWIRLSNLDVGSLSELDQLEKDAIDLRNTVSQELVAAAAETVAEPGLNYLVFRATDVLQDFVPTLGQLLGALRLDVAGKEPESPIAQILRTPEEIRTSLRRWNWIFLAVVALSVLIVGLSTQYATKLNFGSQQDYIVLLAWGFVGAGALQLIRNFVGGASLLGR